MYMSRQSLRRQKGFNFIELIIVIGILGGLAAWAVMRGETTKTSGNVQQAVQALSSITGAVESAYSSQTGYPGLDNAAIYGTLPTGMQGSGTSDIGHPWDANGVTVTSVNSDAEYSVAFDSLPAPACQMLANKFLGRFQSTSIGGTTVSNPGQVATNCSGDSNTITWVSE